MKTDILINGPTTLVLTPENDMEREILKNLIKQDNELIELRSAVHVLGKTLRDGIIITKKGTKVGAEKISEAQTATDNKGQDEA